jgi:aldehyde dehydrogenase (NAD+)
MNDVPVPQTSTREPIAAIVARLRTEFDSGRTRPLQWRLEQLAGLGRFLKERELDINRALAQDLGKPEIESYTSEIAFLAREVTHARRNLRAWTRPQRVRTPLLAWPGTSRIHHEPLGVILIIAPWNYPIQLTLGPVVGALAAGNCAIVKPSELAPAPSALLAGALSKYVDQNAVQVVEGAIEETTALLDERFDHIFYTGNGTVGRIVLQAAAKHLTPCTMELGGKSPCLVDECVDLDVAARRLVWGKFYNAGESCVAPDYVLVHEAIEDALLARMKKTLEDFFGADPRHSPDYGRIVNVRHHRRLVQLLAGSGSVLVGGEADEAARYLAPTILRDVPAASPVMSDEIFGPILPVLRVKHMDDAIRFVNARPKPLALYLFSKDANAVKRVLEHTSSGGAVVNHTLLHEVISSLPFGGVGASGMGSYHGKATFETLSHRKSVLMKPTWFDLPILYPPYDKRKTKWLRRIV